MSVGWFACIFTCAAHAFGALGVQMRAGIRSPRSCGWFYMGAGNKSRFCDLLVQFTRAAQCRLQFRPINKSLNLPKEIETKFFPSSAISQSFSCFCLPMQMLTKHLPQTDSLIPWTGGIWAEMPWELTAQMQPRLGSAEIQILSTWRSLLFSTFPVTDGSSRCRPATSAASQSAKKIWHLLPARACCLISIPCNLKLDDIARKMFIPRKAVLLSNKGPALQQPLSETTSDLDEKGKRRKLPWEMDHTNSRVSHHP